MAKLEGQGGGSMKYFNSWLLWDTPAGRGQAQPIAGTAWTQVQQIRFGLTLSSSFLSSKEACLLLSYPIFLLGK